jgi:hypothetical protein
LLVSKMKSLVAAGSSRACGIPVSDVFK